MKTFLDILAYAATILSLPTLVLSFVAAFQLGINPLTSIFDLTTVVEAKRQADYWERNSACWQQEGFSELQKQVDTISVYSAICPTGDVRIEFRGENGAPIAGQWFGLDEAKASASLPLLFGRAYAGPVSGRPKTMFVQNRITVKCQTLIDGARLTRIVEQGGICFSETLDLRTGGSVERKEVPCDTQCPARQG